jgi:hypothetical protein
LSFSAQECGVVFCRHNLWRRLALWRGNLWLGSKQPRNITQAT